MPLAHIKQLMRINDALLHDVKQLMRINDASCTHKTINANK